MTLIIYVSRDLKWSGDERSCDKMEKKKKKKKGRAVSQVENSKIVFKAHNH